MRSDLEKIVAARRRAFMKRALEVVGWLAAVLIFALAGRSAFFAA